MIDLHTADGDDGMHHRRLDDMAPCHVVARTLHRQARSEPPGVVTWCCLLVVGVGCCRSGWPVVVGGDSDSGGWG